MTVDYYEVRDCTVEQLGGRTVLAAPPQEVSRLLPEILMRCGFLKEADGRWYHWLTDAELQLLQGAQGSVRLSFGGDALPPNPILVQEPEREAPAANYLTGGSLLAMLMSLILPYHSNPDIIMLRGVLIVTGWVLLIVARVKYPKNTFAKVVMWVYIVLMILGFLFMVAVGIFIIYTCNECVSSCPD